MRQTKENFNIKMDDGICKMDNGLVVNLSIGYQPCTNELMTNELVTNELVTNDQ